MAAWGSSWWDSGWGSGSWTASGGAWAGGWEDAGRQSGAGAKGRGRGQAPQAERRGRGRGKAEAEAGGGARPKQRGGRGRGGAKGEPEEAEAQSEPDESPLDDVTELERAMASAKISDLCSAPEKRKIFLVFCPDPGPGKFTATFEAAPPMENFASVNAGSGRSLKVGGSGLNGQFEKDLASAGQPVERYQRLHQSLMTAACAAPGRLVGLPSEALRSVGGAVAACFGRVASSDGRGFVAIDVFARESRPLNVENIAMVYCVGPDRRELRGDAEFLEHLAELGEGLAQVCCGYNSRLANVSELSHLPALWRVRVGLVSGGKYAGRVPKEKVARALLEGLSRGVSGFESEADQTGGDEMEFEMAFDKGVFEDAWKVLQEEEAVKSS